MINRTLEEQLEALTSRLARLTAEHDNIKSRVLNTRREAETIIAEISARSREETVTNTTREAMTNRTSALVGSGYYVGDQVIVINPSEGQGNHGVVIGEKERFTKNKTSARQTHLEITQERLKR